MDTAYKPWIGHAVVLQVALGDIKVPLRGRLLKDGGETLRMRIGEGWDVDIYKTLHRTHRGEAGMWSQVRQPGFISEGDAVEGASGAPDIGVHTI